MIEQNVISENTADGVIAFIGGLVLGNAIVSNEGYGLVSGAVSTGYGNNLLFGNKASGTQVFGPAVQLHLNVCQPACP